MPTAPLRPKAIAGDPNRTFSPTTSTLIFGANDAVLVDALLIKEDVDARPGPDPRLHCPTRETISVVPRKGLIAGSGCPPTSISSSFLPFALNLITVELPASTDQTLPSGSSRIACGILYSPLPNEPRTRPSLSTAMTRSALSPRRMSHVTPVFGSRASHETMP